MANHPQNDPTTRYALDAVAGKLPAGKWVRLACERHLRDLSQGPSRGMVFDVDAANHAIEFFRFLSHTKGRWNSQAFELSPWQAFIVGSIFGWKIKGKRRFKIAFVEVPRKNGKTTLAAGIALYLMLCDGEAGAEIYSAATKKDQAKLVFEDAKAFILGNPDLASVVDVYKHSLKIPAIRSKFEALGADADSLDGLNPFVAICDEIHAWKSRDMWDVLLTGMGAREQPLALPITTAGDFSDSIYNELHNDCEQILENVVQDDAIFAYIATVNPEDNWLDPEAWKRANPNMGVSLREEELAEVIHRAKRQPSSQNKIKRNRLNIRTSALDSWIRIDIWDQCGEPFEESELAGQPCWGGLDLANTSDLAAFVLAFPWDMSRGEQAYRIIAQFWCPEATDDANSEKLRRKLWPWVQSGHVEFTPGETIDLARIEQHIKQAANDYNLRGVLFDPWNAAATAQNLISNGINAIKFNQRASSYNEPSRAMEKAVIDRRLYHGGNPVLRWMASNCVVRVDGTGCLMPDRRRSRDKIDGIPALIMAIAGCRLDSPEAPSIYETKGLD